MNRTFARLFFAAATLLCLAQVSLAEDKMGGDKMETKGRKADKVKKGDKMDKHDKM